MTSGAEISKQLAMLFLRTPRMHTSADSEDDCNSHTSPAKDSATHLKVIWNLKAREIKGMFCYRALRQILTCPHCWAAKITSIGSIKTTLAILCSIQRTPPWITIHWRIWKRISSKVKCMKHMDSCSVSRVNSTDWHMPTKWHSPVHLKFQSCCRKLVSRSSRREIPEIQLGNCFKWKSSIQIVIKILWCFLEWAKNTRIQNTKKDLIVMYWTAFRSL